jgi:hypothetical protein
LPMRCHRVCNQKSNKLQRSGTTTHELKKEYVGRIRKGKRISILFNLHLALSLRCSLKGLDSLAWGSTPG